MTGNKGWNKKKIQFDFRKQFSPRGSSNAGPGAQRACGISILRDVQTLAGGDSEQPDPALMSPGAWSPAVRPVLHGVGLGVQRGCCRCVSSAPSSGQSRENRSRTVLWCPRLAEISDDLFPEVVREQRDL